MPTLAPDGRTLSVSGNPHGFMGPWSFMLWVHGSQSSYRVHTGARGSMELANKHSGRYDALTVREASDGRIRLLSLEDPEQGGTSLLWQSDFHEVSTFVHGVGVPFEVLTKMLAPLELTDTREGVVVRARRGTGTEITYTLGANFIPRLSGVTVKPVETVEGQVPTTGGRAVPGGRLWRNDEQSEDGKLHRTLMLANTSTATFLTPFEPDHPDLVTLLESVEFQLS